MAARKGTCKGTIEGMTPITGNNFYLKVQVFFLVCIVVRKEVILPFSSWIMGPVERIGVAWGLFLESPSIFGCIHPMLFWGERFWQL
jgi:hypothetical protein